MPWRLISWILSFIVILFFTGFNLDNKVNISLIFVKFEQVPVFIIVFVSFILGLLFAVPLSIRSRIRSKKQPKQKEVVSKPIYDETSFSKPQS